MTVGIVQTHRNARGQVLINAIDAGSGPGRLKIFKGTRPSTGGAPGGGDELADLALADPCGSMSAGVLTFNTIDNQNGSAGGTPTWCRFTDSDGNAVLDGNVGAQGSGELLELDVVAIYAGGSIIISSAALTEGNA